MKWGTMHVPQILWVFLFLNPIIDLSSFQSNKTGQSDSKLLIRQTQLFNIKFRCEKKANELLPEGFDSTRKAEDF